MMDQERVWILLSKKLAGEATGEEEEELEWALTANPEWKKILDTLRALKQAPPKGFSSEEEQRLLEKGLQRWARLEESDYHQQNGGGRAFRVENSTGWKKISPNHRILPYRWMVAASLLIIMVSSVMYLRSRREPVADPATAAPRVIAARRGVRTYVQLPDSSKLWLNAGSKVVYAGGFSGDKRELTLTGEAFFEVKHDVDHPFLIHAGKLLVRVLGTSLNVKAYPGDSTIETTLIKGKVEIDFAGNSRAKILLKPSEKVVIAANPATIPLNTRNTRHDTLAATGLPAFTRSVIVADKTDGTFAETSWVDDRLVFRNESLSGLAGRLERWYDIKICFDSDKYRQENVTGAFKDARLEDVMHALQLTTGLHYRIAADTVRIW